MKRTILASILSLSTLIAVQSPAQSQDGAPDGVSAQQIQNPQYLPFEVSANGQPTTSPQVQSAGESTPYLGNNAQIIMPDGSVQRLAPSNQAAPQVAPQAQQAVNNSAARNLVRANSAVTPRSARSSSSAAPVAANQQVALQPQVMAAPVAAGVASGGFVSQQAFVANPPATIAPVMPSGGSSFDAASVGNMLSSGGGAYTSPTGTKVGVRVQSLYNDFSTLFRDVQQQYGSFEGLKSNGIAGATDYHGLVGEINAHLQSGTTPGNPRLVAKWNQANSRLDQMSEAIGGLNVMASRVAESASVAAFLADGIRAAFGVSGAVEEDHAALSELQDANSELIVRIESLLDDVSDELSRRNRYITTERRNLQTLALSITNGELYGQSLSNTSPSRIALAGPLEEGGAFGGTSGFGGGKIPASLSADGAARPDTSRPLVVIRFDRPDVQYDQALYAAVSQALERFPRAVFELVSVTPPATGSARGAILRGEAQRRTEEVYRALKNMGLPEERLGFASQENPSARSSEVHIYVR